MILLPLLLDVFKQLFTVTSSIYISLKVMLVSLICFELRCSLTEYDCRNHSDMQWLHVDQSHLRFLSLVWRMQIIFNYFFVIILFKWGTYM